jgi:S-adenosylmethionine decarboxylase
MNAARYHIIVDLSNLPHSPLEDVEGMQMFLQRLPGLIGMSILHGPVVKVGIPENPGITGFVIIDYSHISAHTFTKYSEVLVDIFSCKPYDQEAALQATVDHFQATKEHARVQVVSWGE